MLLIGISISYRENVLGGTKSVFVMRFVPLKRFLVHRIDMRVWLAVINVDGKS